ncbi:Fc receptor-like 6, partial [Corchorus olitorius]
QCTITATDASGNTTVNYSCGAGGSISLKTNEPQVFQTDSYQVEMQAYDKSLTYNS